MLCRRRTGHTGPAGSLPPRPPQARPGVAAESLAQGPLTSSNHLNSHSDPVFPEPFEDLPEVPRPQLPAERELLPWSLPVFTVRQGLGLVLEGQAGTRGSGIPHSDPRTRSPCSVLKCRTFFLVRSQGPACDRAIPGAAPTTAAPCSTLQTPSPPAVGRAHWLSAAQTELPASRWLGHMALIPRLPPGQRDAGHGRSIADLSLVQRRERPGKGRDIPPHRTQVCRTTAPRTVRVPGARSPRAPSSQPARQDPHPPCVPWRRGSHGGSRVPAALPSGRARSAAGRGTGSGLCGVPGARTGWGRTQPHGGAAGWHAAVMPHGLPVPHCGGEARPGGHVLAVPGPPLSPQRGARGPGIPPRGTSPSQVRKPRPSGTLGTSRPLEGRPGGGVGDGPGARSPEVKCRWGRRLGRPYLREHSQRPVFH